MCRSISTAEEPGSSGRTGKSLLSTIPKCGDCCEASPEGSSLTSPPEKALKVRQPVSPCPFGCGSFVFTCDINRHTEICRHAPDSRQVVLYATSSDSTKPVEPDGKARRGVTRRQSSLALAQCAQDQAFNQRMEPISECDSDEGDKENRANGASRRRTNSRRCITESQTGRGRGFWQNLREVVGPLCSEIQV